MIPQRAQWRWLARTYSSTSLISDSISRFVTSCPVQRTKTYSHSKTYSYASACSSVVLKLQLFGVIPQAITKEIIFNRLSALQSTTHGYCQINQGLVFHLRLPDKFSQTSVAPPYLQISHTKFTKLQPQLEKAAETFLVQQGFSKLKWQHWDI